MQEEMEFIDVMLIKPDPDCNDAVPVTPKVKKKRTTGSEGKKTTNRVRSITPKKNTPKSSNAKSKKSNAMKNEEQSLIALDQIDNITVDSDSNIRSKVTNVKTYESESTIIVRGDEIFEEEINNENDGHNETNIGDNDCLLMEIVYDEAEEINIWGDSGTHCDEEEQMVKDFLSKECCKRQCNTKFKSEELLLYRLELQSIDYNEHGVNQLDLVLLGLIHSLVRVSDEIRHSRCVKQMPRKRIKMMFAFRGISVCRAMFMFAHAIKIERLKRLIKRYKHEGIAPKPHGNYQRVPVNAITVEQIKEVVAFLRNYAKENAAIVPGRSSYLNEDIKILPPQETKVRIFNKYKQVCAQQNTSCISVVSFRRLWNRYCPDIVIQRPESNGSSSKDKDSE